MDSDPTPGNPDEVRSLAEELQEFADDVGEALGKIRGMASDRAVHDWTGLSAEAFRSEFDGVPENLTKLQNSYDLCAQALNSYWPTLENAQGMADRALERAIAAQSDLTAAQGQLTDAEDWVSRAGEEAQRLEDEGRRENNPPPDEADVRAATRDHQAAQDAAASAQSRVEDAEARLSAARQLARDAQEMREDAARACAQGIDEASDAGIHNRRWWEDAVHWVTENWDTIVDVCRVIVAVLGVVVMIIGGPLAWVVLAAALVVLADTLMKYANGEASLWDVAFAALDCIPGMKGLTTLGGLARGTRSLASTGLRGLRQGALRLGRRTRGDGVPMNGRLACGDPVDMATGELLMSTTDVELPGVLPLVIERHHISSYRAGRWFGTSWASTLDQRLLLDEYGVRLFTADGMTLLYPRPLPGEAVLPVEGPRWGLSWDGQPGSPITVEQRENGRTLHFAPIPGRPGSELPLMAMTDRKGNRIHVEYDEAGTPTDMIHDGGYHIGIDSENGRITALRLLNAPDQPVLLRYGHDEAGLLSEVFNSSGQPLKFFYDGQFRLSRWEDRNGYWYCYEYDADGRCVHTTGTDGVLEYRYAYDPENHRTTATNSLSHTTTYAFNDSFQLVAETDPLGHTTHHTRDRYDRTLTTTDPLGRTTRYDYDDEGNVVAIVRPDGSEIRAEYNEFGLETEVVQADGSVWRQSYDSGGSRTVFLDPAGNRTRYTYDEHGGLATITDATGQTTHIRCDDAGLPIAVTNPLGESTGYTRDAFGRVTAVIDPMGAVSRMERTVEGKPWRQTDSLGGVQTWTWDAEGNCLTHTDENGGTTCFEYGAFDQVGAQIDPDGARYEFVRDTELQLTAVINPHGLTWDYAYDAAGHLIHESDFDNRTLTYTYDAAGHVTTRTNALGQPLTFTYDALGHLTSKRADERVTSFKHDALGRLVHAASPGTELVIERDPLGRILSEAVNGRKVNHSYDPAGRLTERVTPASHTSTWTYDAAGRPTSLATAGRTLAFNHDAAGRETHRHVGENVSLHQAWDSAGRLTEQSLGAGPRVLRQRSYAYRPDHHLTGISEPTGADTRFDLDPAGRITRAVTTSRQETYAYDADGNQASASWPQITGHNTDVLGDRSYLGTRITRAGRTRYEHDEAGRVVLRQTVRLSKKPETWRYTWDAEDRLTQVTTPDGTTWRYQYDPLGRRIAKQRLADDGGIAEQTTFTWSDTTLVEQTTTGTDVTAPTTLTWDYNGLQPLAQTEHRTSQEEFDRRFYAIVTDLVGTPTELIDDTGDVVWHSTTTIWGAGVPSTARAQTPLRFPGQYHDPETGWHYNHHRHYDPHTARYTSPDPLGLAPGPNHYGYVHNPHTWSDPLGLAAHAIVNPGKFDYLFGRVASNSHNLARSRQNAAQLARIGVHDNPAGRQLLSQHFDDVINSNSNIMRTYTDQHGTFQIRDSLFAGPGGFLHFETTWQATDDGLRLTTVIPRGGR